VELATDGYRSPCFEPEVVAPPRGSEPPLFITEVVQSWVINSYSEKNLEYGTKRATTPVCIKSR
jgi:hypothetical protein